MIAFCKCVDEKLLAPMMRRKKRRKRRINIFCIFASSSVDASAAPTRAVILSEGYPKREREREREVQELIINNNNNNCGAREKE